MKLTFFGGAGEVTGALYLLEDGDTKIIVECGLAQGSSEQEKQNLEEFKFNPKEIDAVFVTHAHLDHIGRIPKLVRDGYDGPIYSTGPTKDAAQFLLLDAEGLMSHKNTKPIYDVKDIDKALQQWKIVHYHSPMNIKSLKLEFFNAGHILGSASIKISSSTKTIVFSGDLGNMPVPMINGTEYLKDVDYVLVESAYGNRIHDPIEERRNILEDVIENTVKEGGVLLIPSFALERTQQLLYELNELVENERIPNVPIFIDSPLAIKLTSVYEKYSLDPEFFSNEVIAQIKKGDEIFNFPNLKFTLTSNESKHINSVPSPKIIIAGSGMSVGGRILFHEQKYLSDSSTTILFVGFQPKGSIGRQMLEGKKEIRIMGERVPVRANIVTFSGYSAHADQPLLMKWVSSMKDTLKKVFVVQGEPDQGMVLAEKIRNDFAVDAEVPEIGEVFEF